MKRFRSRGLSRRSFLTAAALGAAAFSSRIAIGAGQETGTIEGDCTTEPAVNMYIDWRSGKQIYPTLGDAAPPPTWVQIPQQTFPSPYLMPPDWSSVVLWADSYDQDGVPEWQDQQLYLPQLTLLRLISPDGDAVYEYAVGSVQPYLLTTVEAANLAKVGLLGADPKLRQVCLYDDQNNALSPNWFSADRYKTNLLMTGGNAMQLPDAFLPGTVVSYTNLFGPRRQMENLMFDVFLRILFQGLAGDYETESPTPTPDD